MGDGDTSSTGEDEGAEGQCPEGMVTYVGSVYADSNAGLDPLFGVECLDGSLGVDAPIADLQQLASLELVLGSVSLAVDSLAGLENLTTVHGNVLIDRATLVTLDGLDGLTEVIGEFQIKQANLADVDALAQLTSVGNLLLGAFDGGAPCIGNIEGLSTLASVEGLFVRSTYCLQSLAGLENLASVVGIQIVENQALQDVTAIGGGVALVVPAQLSISDNPMLPTCNAMQLADTLEVLGGTSIVNNLPDACG